ncbi:hypothetical protein D9M71_388560 [compost metagenome]
MQCLPMSQQAAVLRSTLLGQETAQMLKASLRFVQARMHRQGAGIQDHQRNRAVPQLRGYLLAPLQYARKIVPGQQPAGGQGRHIVHRYIRLAGAEGQVDGILDKAHRA